MASQPLLINERHPNPPTQQDLQDTPSGVSHGLGELVDEGGQPEAAVPDEGVLVVAGGLSIPVLHPVEELLGDVAVLVVLAARARPIAASGPDASAASQSMLRDTVGSEATKP